MKVIIVYSGKGGVGKTTTTANIGRTLVEQGHKVYILDADVNTPSMPVIFPTPQPSDNLRVASLGYMTSKTIYVTDSSIRSYIGVCIQQINQFQPDYVLIDTPPSITDVHINLLNKIKPSGLIVVTQPNVLSLADVNRTALFFQEKGVNIIGIVENMATQQDAGTYTWKVLASIPFAKDFNFNTVYEESKPLYKEVVKHIENIDSVILENKRRQLFDETITKDDIRSLPFLKKNDLKFINLSTWDTMKEYIGDSELFYDEGLSSLTTENIGRMLKAFETDEEALFMVTKAPSTGVFLIAGEIGQGSLTVADSYYGVPRVKYHTSQGEVVLFPYEIMPVDNQLLLESLANGYVATKDGRYLPSKSDVTDVYNAFGSRVGLHDDWEKKYDDIVSGNLPMYHEAHTGESNVVNPDSRKSRRTKAERTIGDFADRNTIL